MVRTSLHAASISKIDDSMGAQGAGHVPIHDRLRSAMGHWCSAGNVDGRPNATAMDKLIHPGAGFSRSAASSLAAPWGLPSHRLCQSERSPPAGDGPGVDSAESDRFPHEGGDRIENGHSELRLQCSD